MSSLFFHSSFSAQNMRIYAPFYIDFPLFSCFSTSIIRLSSIHSFVGLLSINLRLFFSPSFINALFFVFSFSFSLSLSRSHVSSYHFFLQHQFENLSNRYTSQTAFHTRFEPPFSRSRVDCVISSSARRSLAQIRTELLISTKTTTIPISHRTTPTTMKINTHLSVA